MIYRKIWEKHFGKIPKDENGRSYEIHHIDGNKKNNSIENLKCISIDEHYKIHLNQKDYFSANLIASRMKLNPNEQLELNKNISNSTKGKPKRKNNCKYCNLLISVNGINVHERTCKQNPNRYSIPNPKISKLLKNTKRSIEHREKIKQKLLGTNQPIIECPHCGKSGGNMMKVWHFDNCLLKPGNESKKRFLTEEHKKNLKKPKKKNKHGGLNQ
jgi:hypothetical protein